VRARGRRPLGVSSSPSTKSCRKLTAKHTNATADFSADDAATQARSVLIRAAMERAKAMQAATKPRNTRNLPAQIEQRLREIDARRARVEKPNKEGKP